MNITHGYWEKILWEFFVFYGKNGKKKRKYCKTHYDWWCGFPSMWVGWLIAVSTRVADTAQLVVGNAIWCCERKFLVGMATTAHAHSYLAHHHCWLEAVGKCGRRKLLDLNMMDVRCTRGFTKCGQTKRRRDVVWQTCNRTSGLDKIKSSFGGDNSFQWRDQVVFSDYQWGLDNNHWWNRLPCDGRDKHARRRWPVSATARWHWTLRMVGAGEQILYINCRSWSIYSALIES